MMQVKHKSSLKSMLEYKKIDKMNSQIQHK